MADTVHCEHCDRTWSGEALDPIHDYWSRVDPGGVVPVGQCPNPDCGALCYPPYGYAYDLEQRCAALYDIVSRLLDWEALMGGWEVPVWDEARRLLARLAQGDERISELAARESERTR